MVGKREKPSQAEAEERHEQKQETKQPPAAKELKRSELEALRQNLQRKFHR